MHGARGEIRCVESIYFILFYFSYKLRDEYADGRSKGPLVRIGPNDVVCADVEELYRIQGVKSGYVKNKWYELGRMSRDSDIVFSTHDPEMRRAKKKKLAPGVSQLSSSLLLPFESWFERMISELVFCGAGM